jgi:PKD repeat protein
MNHHPRARAAIRIVVLAPLLLTLAAGAIGAAVTGGGQAAAVVSARSCPRASAPAGILGMVPSRAPFGCTAAVMASGTAPRIAPAGPLIPSYNGGSPPLLYGGGAVVGTAGTSGEHTVHPIFWAPAGYSFPTGYEAGVDTYLTDVAADSGKASNVYSVLSQYTDGQVVGTPHLGYDVHVGAPVDVTDAFPTVGGCAPDAAYGELYTACITDQQMHSEISGVLAANSLPVGMGDIYVVIFPSHVETCVDALNAHLGGTCSDTNYPGFCGYHSAFSAASNVALYANIPFPTSFYFSCMTSESPSGSVALDSALTMISHEHNETITDPLGNAWIDSVNNENGDECAWAFGSSLGGPAGALWNQVINGHHYYLQQEFSNEEYALNHANGCALTQAVPVASVAVTTAHPTAALTTAFDGSASSDPNVANGITDWSWDFGDATPAAAGATPTHVYTAGGTYTVALTVTDVDGFSATASRQLVVAPPSPPPPPPTAPAFTSASPPLSGTVGKAYTYTFAASGVPVPTYALSGAPGWLSITAATGAVSGTPPVGTTSFSYSVTAANGVGQSPAAGPFIVTVGNSSGPQGGTHGYWLVGADGGIFSFGGAGFHGSTGSFALQRPVVGVTPTTDRAGYWLVGADGGIFAFGDSGFYGSLPGLGFAPAGDTSGRPPLAAPIVAMVPSSDGAGYFMVAADGGIFAFGDAKFAGSCPGIGGCAGAAVAVMPDASGMGYWLVTATGGIYAFGDAAFFGSPPHRPVAVTSAVRTPDGGGYWVLFADGRVTAFGDAVNHGDPAGSLGGDTATAIFATSDGAGYWVATASGVVDNYGDAPADGSMAGAHLNAPIVAASGW